MVEFGKAKERYGADMCGFGKVQFGNVQSGKRIAMLSPV